MTEPAAGRSEHERGQTVPAEREQWEPELTELCLAQRRGDTLDNAYTPHSPILVL